MNVLLRFSVSLCTHPPFRTASVARARKARQVAATALAATIAERSRVEGNRLRRLQEEGRSSPLHAIRACVYAYINMCRDVRSLVWIIILLNVRIYRAELRVAQLDRMQRDRTEAAEARADQRHREEQEREARAAEKER
jgi:hypothetical protein